MADIEGLKLDFLILQKQSEENTRLLAIINSQKQDENASCTELLHCRKRCETLLSSVSKKDNAIRELEEKCVLSLEQESGSLRLALTIIAQEKSEVDNNQSRSRECWVQVDKSLGKYGSQKSVPANTANTTKTRSSFEPLRNNVRNNVGLEMRNVDRGDNGQQSSLSSPSSQRRTRKTKTMQTVKEPQSAPGNNAQTRKPVTVIAGDSIIQNIRGWSLSWRNN